VLDGKRKAASKDRCISFIAQLCEQDFKQLNSSYRKECLHQKWKE
jgi:hypothetical protein